MKNCSKMQVSIDFSIEFLINSPAPNQYKCIFRNIPTFLPEIFAKIRENFANFLKNGKFSFKIIENLKRIFPSVWKFSLIFL